MNTHNTEIYPMPSFVRMAVGNVDATAEWYRSIGFYEIFRLAARDDSAVMSHLRFAKYADLMLVAGGAHHETNNDLTIYFTVDAGGTDAIAARADAEDILFGPALQPWNARELVLRDPNGYRIAFAERGDPSLSFDDVMRNVARTDS